MTGTVSLCEQQSAAVYIDCVTVWVSSVKKATKMVFLVSLFIAFRQSAFENARIAERVFKTFDDMQFCFIS
jgi:hypothetical protein